MDICKMEEKEQMDIVVVGHVDHGKSTVVGRLLADTKSLPEGKLEQVKERCKRESKVFEYAFLLDALHDEQDQGITIDSARCFFKSKKRDYIIIDAPGHIEFLKNMISGAARAEAAVLVIDAKEGVQENSRRHGYMLAMLGISQVMICVNKMDLVDYSEDVFNKIKEEYTEFLKSIKVIPLDFIPVSGLKGDNIAELGDKLTWFKGNTILEGLDEFKKEKSPEDKPFRMSVQQVYKFTNEGDDRRIIAGRIEAGSISVGDNVIFLPSNKRSQIKSIEGFNVGEQKKISIGFSTGFTLTEQIYVNRGELMCKESEKLPYVSSLIKANIFWMGKEPLITSKNYKLKVATTSVPIKIKEIVKVLDASSLGNEKKSQVDRHEVAECIIECTSPIAFDLSQDIRSTGRFVIVDNYDIAGGGIISEYMEDSQSKIRTQVFLREEKWDHSHITFDERALRYGQIPKLILITGPTGQDKKSIAKELEKKLFEQGRKVYFLGIGNILRGLDADLEKKEKERHIRRLGEVSHILMDSGLIVIATASDLSDNDIRLLQTITYKNEMLVVTIGNQYSKDKTINDELIDLKIEDQNINSSAVKIMDLMRFNNIVFNVKNGR